MSAKKKTVKATRAGGGGAASAASGTKKRTKKTARKAPGGPGFPVDAALLDQLVEEAKLVRENAYAPYSNYKVGAAIVTRSGSLYTGCNVENSTLGATICAERGAILQMAAHGDYDPIACAVVTQDGGSPCGICRQVLAEFATDMPIVLASLEESEGEVGRVVALSELLPLAFRLKQ